MDHPGRPKSAPQGYAPILWVAAALGMTAVLRWSLPEFSGGSAVAVVQMVILFAVLRGGPSAGLITTLLGVLILAFIRAQGFHLPDLTRVPELAALAALATSGVTASALGRRISEARQELAGERARAAASASIRSLFDSVTDVGLVTLDPAGKITGWNSGAARIFGFGAVDILGRHVCRLYFEEEMRRNDPERELGHAAEFARYEGRVWRVRSDGQPVRVAWTVTRITDKAGRVAGFLIMARDITRAEQEQEEQRRTLEELRDLARHLHAVRETERGRIAREIHDELGQILTCLKIELDELRHCAGNASEAEAVLARLKSQVDVAIRSMRRISTELRPRVLDDLGLAAAVEWQTREFESRTGIECRLAAPLPELKLDRHRSSALFRILQESLTNAARHSGATYVEVQLSEEAGGALLLVRDNGRGLAAPDPSGRRPMGLVGMRERALTFGGSVDVESVPGEGVLVRAWIPAAPEEAS